MSDHHQRDAGWPTASGGIPFSSQPAAAVLSALTAIARRDGDGDGGVRDMMMGAHGWSWLVGWWIGRRWDSPLHIPLGWRR
jgi:hypothetical protein